MSYWSSAQRVDYVSFHQAASQIKAWRVTCILFPKMKGFPVEKVPACFHNCCKMLSLFI
jgi:hypothetical protein